MSGGSRVPLRRWDGEGCRDGRNYWSAGVWQGVVPVGRVVGQGHRVGKLSQRRQPVMTSWAAVENSRKRSFLTSQRRASRGAERGERLRPGRVERVDETGDRRVEVHRTEHRRLGPQHADVGQTIAAEHDGRATSSGIFPGPCTARRLRHGANGADIALSRPDLRTVSTSSTEPARATTPRPPLPTRTRG